MIKFFRKIRQQLLTANKFSKYLLYAIGEIVLVVIGILVALQINQWNTNTKNNSLEKIYLQRLKADVNWNIEELTRIINIFSRQEKTIEEYLKGNEGHKRNIWINFMMAHQTRNSTYNELVSTGSLKLIKDIHLRDMLDDLRAFTEYSYRELEYHRQFSVLDQQALRSINQLDFSVVNDSLVIHSSIDIEKLNSSPELKKILSHWKGICLEFIGGLSRLKVRNQEIKKRIACLQSDNGCDD